MSDWVKLKPGDRIDALSELEVTGDGDGFKFLGITEAAEGMNCAIWIEDNSVDGGQWFEVEWRQELNSYAYSPSDPLD